MKKNNVSIFASLLALESKGFGYPRILYGSPSVGPSFLEPVLRLVQTIVAPILFFIGMIIYLKKSKASKKKKIIITIIFVLLLIGIYCGLEFLLERLFGSIVEL